MYIVLLICTDVCPLSGIEHLEHVSGRHRCHGGGIKPRLGSSAVLARILHFNPSTFSKIHALPEDLMTHLTFLPCRAASGSSFEKSHVHQEDETEALIPPSTFRGSPDHLQPSLRQCYNHHSRRRALLLSSAVHRQTDSELHRTRALRSMRLPPVKSTLPQCAYVCQQASVCRSPPGADAVIAPPLRCVSLRSGAVSTSYACAYG